MPSDPAGAGGPVDFTGEFILTLADGEHISADALILAVPAYTAGGLLGSLHSGLGDALAEIDYSSTVSVWLAYNESSIPLKLDATGYVVPRALGRPVMACTWASAKFPGRAPRDHAHFRLFFGGATGVPLAARSDGEIISMAIAEMREVMGVTAEPRVLRLDRLERSMPQYNVGHLVRIARVQELSSRIPGLALAGAAYNGVGIPDCISSGQRAADIAMGHVAALRRSEMESTL
jgi:oxygen-dependent protoporphyrinogen oxidase